MSQPGGEEESETPKTVSDWTRELLITLAVFKIIEASKQGKASKTASEGDQDCFDVSIRLPKEDKQVIDLLASFFIEFENPYEITEQETDVEIRAQRVEKNKYIVSAIDGNYVSWMEPWMDLFRSEDTQETNQV